jgi:hypothetical protein
MASHFPASAALLCTGSSKAGGVAMPRRSDMISTVYRSALPHGLSMASPRTAQSPLTVRYAVEQVGRTQNPTRVEQTGLHSVFGATRDVRNLAE